MDDSLTIGTCDCGATYDIGSRTDHDADSGQCWNCSERTPERMTAQEWETYLLG